MQGAFRGLILMLLAAAVVTASGLWFHSRYTLSWQSPVVLRLQSPIVIAERTETESRRKPKPINRKRRGLKLPAQFFRNSGGIMSFLEDMAGKEVSSMLANSSNPLASSVMQMINSQPGGISGLLQQFHEKGLGSLVTSWVGTGQNLPISAEQIQHVLGSEQVKELAAKAGISPDAASSHLAQLLPMLIDKLTPNGQVPQGGNSSLIEEGMGMLKNLGLGKTGTDS